MDEIIELRLCSEFLALWQFKNNSFVERIVSHNLSSYCVHYLLKFYRYKSTGIVFLPFLSRPYSPHRTLQCRLFLFRL